MIPWKKFRTTSPLYVGISEAKRLLSIMLKLNGRNILDIINSSSTKDFDGYTLKVMDSTDTSMLFLTYAAKEIGGTNELEEVMGARNLQFEMERYGKIVPIIGGRWGRFDLRGRKRIHPGDIIFYRDYTCSHVENNLRVGVVYLFTPKSGNFHMVTTNFSGYIKTVVMNYTDEHIVARAVPDYCFPDRSFLTRNSAHETFYLDDVQEDAYRDIYLKYHGIIPPVRYFGRVFGQSKSLRLGPGEHFKQVPWCPEVYSSYVIAIHDVVEELSISNTGDPTNWLFVSVDGKYFGYILGSVVVPNEEIDVTPLTVSGQFAVGDDVDVYENSCMYTGQHDTCRYSEIEPDYRCIKETVNGKIVDMDLYSTNPYKVVFRHPKEAIRGMLPHDDKYTAWVRPLSLGEKKDKNRWR